MAKTYFDYTGDGSRTVYPATFALGILQRDDVYVYTGTDYQAQVDYTWPDSSTIELTTPIGIDEKLRIRRVVSRDTPHNDFQGGAVLEEHNLDMSFLQALMLIEEIDDGFLPPSFTYQQDVSFGNNKIIDLADGTEEGDAVTMRQYAFLYDNVGRVLDTPEFKKIEEALDQFEIDYAEWLTNYRGAGADFPVTTDERPLTNGALFYYSGIEHSNGLYIHYESYNEPNTGPWRLVSGVGPAGPTGAQGVEGPKGAQGVQGETGSRGEQGVRGIQGVTGEQGPIGNVGAQGNPGPRGPQGIEGPQGAQGDLGPEGPQGLEGPQGVAGPTGLRGDSFDIDQSGTLLERDGYDTELENFVYYATDYIAVEGITPKYNVFDPDGTTIDWNLDWQPSGPQSLVVTIGGVPQSPRAYEMIVDGVTGDYLLRISPAAPVGAEIVIREVEVSSGYGAIYIKRSDAAGDWSDPIPFGRGPQGEQGPDGIQGQQGDQGVQGQQGPQGAVGPTGAQGPQGDVGATGAEGPAGPQGDRGIAGVQGSEGERGPKGEQGTRGIEGVRGPQGAQGDVGATGATGPVGPQGPAGNKGPEGDRGSQGIRGSRNFYLAVPSNDLNWSTSRISEALGISGAVSDEDVVTNDKITMYNTGAGYSETRVYIGPTTNGIVTAANAVLLANWLKTDATNNNILEVVNGVSGGVPLQYMTIVDESMSCLRLPFASWGAGTLLGQGARVLVLKPAGMTVTLPTAPDGSNDEFELRAVDYTRLVTVSNISIVLNSSLNTTYDPNAAGGKLVLRALAYNAANTLVARSDVEIDLRPFYSSTLKSYTGTASVDNIGVSVPSGCYVILEIVPDNYLSGAIDRTAADYWWVKGTNKVQDVGATGYTRRKVVITESLLF